MIADDGPLDSPIDLGNYGRTDLADVTESLFPALQGSEVVGIEALTSNGARVGVKLNLERSGPFHFWVDGDELHWGDEAAISGHDWMGRAIPRASERLQI
ncbi:hypothetical protein OK349_17860 [Sphingomonas sp. BT-65]|uniref:hypothetical protein n=1 Tax=Sphingomonas sp. BT-65 TaxID=2989821 RepID=UPI002235920A|nr:hypothetical protein [Sphingomonas sp. BT-65]MCW4463577.1 hypothetical protein [Sphingomonas sp. BT-65]